MHNKVGRDVLQRRPFLAALFTAALIGAAMLCSVDARAALPPLPAKMITSLAQDKEGGIWVGTEDKGVFQLPAGAKKWTNHTATNGIADNDIYALCVDKIGRVWAGTLNHGVSVFNGQSWKNYGVETGPIGERVFDIKCNPLDGDIWMATSAGLARYRMNSSSWAYVTRMNGLPEDQIEAMAFDKTGTIYAGLQCGGIAIARRDDDYAKWKTTAAPWYYDKEQHVPYPTTATGSGLPSNLINDLLVTKDGNVWAATTCGIAWSKDGGANWQYLRGREYAEKIKGLFMPPKGFKEPTKDLIAQLLPEEYVTCLAEAPNGDLLLGFREKGYATFDPAKLAIRNWTKPDKKAPLKDGYVEKLLPLPNGHLLIAGYGGGLSSVPQNATTPTLQSPAAASYRPFPGPAKPPTEEQMSKLAAAVKVWGDEAPPDMVTNFGEDWSTQGDWCIRYGQRTTRLCAISQPDSTTGGDLRFVSAGFIGPHSTANDNLRHWTHWPKADGNVRVLHGPDLGIRRQAEWDDHGEAYPRTFEGPDLWVAVDVPTDPADHVVSLYFYNKDGEKGANRCRDYLLEVREYYSALPREVALKQLMPDRFGLPRNCRNKDLSNAIPQKVLARARLKDFRGGVYKNFNIYGGGRIYVRIVRGNSHNTILSGVFAQRLVEPIVDKDRDGWNKLFYGSNIYERLGAVSPRGISAIPSGSSGELWKAADQTGSSGRGLTAWRLTHLLAYRGALAIGNDPDELALWRWHLRLWNPEARAKFEEAMADAWRYFQDYTCIPCRSADYRPLSPGVIPRSVEEVKQMGYRADWRAKVASVNQGQTGDQKE